MNGIVPFVCLAVALLAFVASCTRYHIRTSWSVESDALAPTILIVEIVVLSSVHVLGGIGLVATLLGWMGWFSATPMAVILAALSIAVWVFAPNAGRVTTRRPHTPCKRWIWLALIVGGATALRLPLHDDALAGRDQGSYRLRARQAVRTGSLHEIDPVLATAGREQAHRVGPQDVLGLYPRDDDAHRRGRYEAAYRPGWYLADRDEGVVVPQFLHMHPMVLATAMQVCIPPGWVVLLEGLLSILAIHAFVGRRWPHGPWPEVAAGLVAIAPISVWVHRNTLSEALASLFWCAAAVAVQRALSSTSSRTQTSHLCDAAMALGLLAWTRGNGWVVAPVVLLALAGGQSRRTLPVRIYGGLLFASVFVHAFTAFPYLHDELLRQFMPAMPITPWRLVLATTFGWLAWARFDAWLGARKLAHAMPWLVPIFGSIVLTITAIRSFVVEDHPPFSRLEPAPVLIGWPILVLAILRLLTPHPRAFPRSRAGAWAWALAGTVVATLALYCPRNLPSVDLYTYGRYLVVELLPVAVVLAIATLRSLVVRCRSRRQRIACSVAGGLVLAWPWVATWRLHPITRLDEFDGARRLPDAIARRIEPGTIVIAGGEGWHHRHTFNQVGGVLAMEHGVSVLPYRDRESTYASLYELIVLGPRARGEPAPKVTLLLNEASRPVEMPEGRTAVIDPSLPPPFRAQRVQGFELFTDRLTPTSRAVPSRVTRDELRVAVLDVALDPSAQESRWTVDPEDERLVPWASRGHHPSPGVCLSSRRPLRVELPAPDHEVRQLVVVARAGHARPGHDWHISIDGEPLAIAAPGAPPRQSNTVGPVPLPDRARVLTVEGAASGDPACPMGRLVEVRLLGSDTPRASILPPRRFTPPHDLGHRPKQTRWVSGRAVTAYRPRQGLPEHRSGLGMRLDPTTPLQFGALDGPPTCAPGTFTITLTGSTVFTSARLTLHEEHRERAVLGIPRALDRAWTSPPQRWDGPLPRHGWQLALESAAAPGAPPEGHVLVRDVTWWCHEF